MSAAVSENPEVPNMFKMENYDIQFTADISKQMRMPDRLAAVGDMGKMPTFSDQPLRSFDINPSALEMTIPDKIFLGETDYNLDHKLKGDDHNEDDEDDDNSEAFDTEYDMDELRPASVSHSNVDLTPPNTRNEVDLFAAGDMVVPATPSSMLRTTSLYASSGPVSADPLAGSGADWMMIQRHVAKLTCRVERLEEENGRRRQREMLLYPLILGYCLLHVARLLLSRSK